MKMMDGFKPKIVIDSNIMKTHKKIMQNSVQQIHKSRAFNINNEFNHVKLQK